MRSAVPVRFMVEAAPSGRVAARGIDLELRLEAESLSALEREARRIVHVRLGAEHDVVMLVGNLARPRVRGDGRL